MRFIDKVHKEELHVAVDNLDFKNATTNGLDFSIPIQGYDKHLLVDNNIMFTPKMECSSNLFDIDDDYYFVRIGLDEIRIIRKWLFNHIRDLSPDFDTSVFDKSEFEY